MKTSKYYNLVFSVVISLLFIIPVFHRSADLMKAESKFPAEKLVPTNLDDPAWKKSVGILRNPGELYSNISQNSKHYFNWFKENFMFTQELLPVYQFYKENILNSNPFPDKVIEGNDNWFFAGDLYEKNLSRALGFECLSPQELEQLVTYIREIDCWCTKRNIKYFIMPPPSKISIYNEYIPIVRPDNPTNLDMLVTALTREGISVIDVRATLLKGKGKQLYMKGDTHWNAHGSILAYEQLMDTISSHFPEIQKQTRAELEFNTIANNQQDLYLMLNRKSNGYNVTVSPIKPFAIKVDKELEVPTNFFHEKKYFEQRFRRKEAGLKVVVFRDSFFESLKDIFVENFEETTLIWINTPDTTVIKIEQPDIVVHQVLERMIPEINTTIK